MEKKETIEERLKGYLDKGVSVTVRVAVKNEDPFEYRFFAGDSPEATERTMAALNDCLFGMRSKSCWSVTCFPYKKKG